MGRKALLTTFAIVFACLVGTGGMEGGRSAWAGEGVCLPPQAGEYLQTVFSAPGAPPISEIRVAKDTIAVTATNPPLSFVLRHPSSARPGAPTSRNFAIDGPEYPTPAQQAAFAAMVRLLRTYDTHDSVWVACRSSRDIPYTKPPVSEWPEAPSRRPSTHSLVIWAVGSGLSLAALFLAWPMWRPLVSRSSWIRGVLLFAAAFGFRYVLAPWSPLSSQGVAYHRLMGHGDGYEFYYASARVLQSLMDAVHPIAIAQWLNLFLSSLSVLSLYAAARLLTSRRGAMLAALLGLVWPYSILYSTSLRAMPMVTLYLPLAVAFLILAAEAPTRRALWTACLWLCAFALSERKSRFSFS